MADVKLNCLSPICLDTSGVNKFVVNCPCSYNAFESVLYRRHDRTHASFFALSKDKQQNELDGAHLFNHQLKNRGVEHFDSIVARVPGKDPLDCEAIGNGGERIGIEVTELVDADAIAFAINGKLIDQDLPISPSQVIEKVSAIVRRKDDAMVNWRAIRLVHIDNVLR